jgi:hypothetical protein
MEWGKIFVEAIENHAAHYDVSAADLADLRARFDTFSDCMAITRSNERTRTAVVRKNEAFAEFELIARAVINSYFRRPSITDADRKSLGLPIPDRTRTLVQPAATPPIFWVVVDDVARVEVRYRSRESSKRARPIRTDGAMIAYDFAEGDPPPPDEMRHKMLSTRTPQKLQFELNDRGKTVYIAICWVNEKGKCGPWSAITSAIVP